MSPYEKALRWLYGLESRGIRLGLERMVEALELRGHPERGPRYVHVAGTNGKGSVTAMVESILRSAGLRTGMFTSPHLHRFVERIQIDGEPLAEARVAAWVEALRSAPSMPPLTLFEVSTLLAFEAFAEAHSEVVALEVGLGGRLDATNVVNSSVSVITTIARDHEHILGSGIGTIAKEKAGILQPGVPAVVGVRSPEALRAIEARATDVGAPLSLIDRDFGAQRVGDELRLWSGSETVEVDSIGLEGHHQDDNAACAFAAVAALRSSRVSVPTEHVRVGLGGVRWPGRLERCTVGDRRYLIDCAHNPEGCRALAAHVKTLPVEGKRVLLFGALGDKDHEEMLSALDPITDEHLFVSPRVPRAIPAERFLTYRPGAAFESLDEALDRAASDAGPGGLVIIAGSIFLIAEARAHLLGVPTDPPTWP